MHPVPTGPLPQYRRRGRPSFASTHEAFEYWSSRKHFFEVHGYELRLEPIEDRTSRYHVGVGEDQLALEPDTQRDIPNTVYAIRAADNQQVCIKRVGARTFELSLHATMKRGIEPHDPANHLVPVLEILKDDEVQGIFYVVMLALSPVKWSSQDTVGDVVEFTSQVLLGLQFLHKRMIAHRDCSLHNIVTDRKSGSQRARGSFGAASAASPSGERRSIVLPGSKHPEKSRESTTKYYFVGVGNATAFPPTSGLCKAECCSLDREPPEFLDEDIGYDPLRLDVFLVGNMLRRQLLERYCNVDFLSEIVQHMLRDAPENRDDIGTILSIWGCILPKISSLHRKQHLRGRNVWPWSMLYRKHSKLILQRRWLH